MKTKKLYKAPKVNKVQLSINNAILSVCHTSPTTLRPKDSFSTCALNPGCYSGPGGPLPSTEG